MRHRPPSGIRGVSLLSAAFLLVALGFAVVIGGRLVPLYFEFKGVSQTLDNVAHSDTQDEAGVRSLLVRGFDSADVTTIKASDVDITREDGALTVSVDYDAVAPFIGNVGFVVHFHKTVTVDGSKQS
jgi:hypothetical protein